VKCYLNKLFLGVFVKYKRIAESVWFFDFFTFILSFALRNKRLKCVWGQCLFISKSLSILFWSPSFKNCFCTFFICLSKQVGFFLRLLFYKFNTFDKRGIKKTSELRFWIKTISSVCFALSIRNERKSWKRKYFKDDGLAYVFGLRQITRHKKKS
jgi:hypothetical protein